MNTCLISLILLFIISSYKLFPSELYKTILKDDLLKSGYNEGDIEDTLRYELDKDNIKNMYIYS